MPQSAVAGAAATSNAAQQAALAHTCSIFAIDLGKCKQGKIKEPQLGCISVQT
jgi:hypothetical protein